jgi:GNAT superfamily N-acetyltransferase
VAEEDGMVVGVGRARLRWEVSSRSVGWLWLGVAPDRRGRGIGSALYAEAERHLREAGAEVLESFSAEPSGRRFLEQRRFRAKGGEVVSALEVGTADLSGLPAFEEARAREGFRLVTLGEVSDRSREVHAVYVATSADMPEEFRMDDVRFHEWERELLADPDLSLEGSAVVLHGELPVSLAIVVWDGEGPAANDMTGTLSAFRRRGLARLAKLATIRWAAANGVETFLTGNAVTNDGMLALNRSLGYRTVAEQTYYVHEQ